MSKIFLTAAAIYVISTVSAGAAALSLTIWAYNLDSRMLSDLVTAAIINTAAAVAAMGFFGGFDMIFTIWQFLRNQEAERTRNQEKEQDHAEREALLALLREEQERNAALTARVLELTELPSDRTNGRDANGDGENSRGE